MNLLMISDTLASMIRIATPLMLMALGGLLCQRAGVFNIALEGFALIGAFTSVAVVQITGGSVILGMVGAAVAGIIYSLIFGLFVTKYRADNIIASIAMNMLGLGITSFLLRAAFKVQGRLAPARIDKLGLIEIPVIKNIPVINCLSGQSIITYVTILISVLIYVILFKTKTGLAICAVGESVEASKTAGIKPEQVRLKVILVSGALSGLAGSYLSTVIVSQFSENMIQGRGFTAFTALVFGNAHPMWTGLVTLLFGLADAIGIRIELSGINLSPSIIKMFPFLMAILAVALSSYMVKLKRQGKRKHFILGKRKERQN